MRASHILVKKLSLADELLNRIKGGEDFGKIAKEYSECPSKKRGGDLGEFGRGQMVKPFEDAAFIQEINAIGPVVETPFGYHIIQVLEHNQPKTRSLSEAKDDIVNDIQQKKLQEDAAKYIAQLKSKAHIVYAESIAPAMK